MLRRLLLLLVVLLAAGCSGNGSSTTGTVGSSGTSLGASASSGAGSGSGTSGATGTSASGGTSATSGGPIPGSFLAGCDGQHTELTGTLTMPNGIDPVSNGVVSVVTRVNPLVHAVACDKCSTTDSPGTVTSVHTGVDGKFTLSLDAVAQSATVQVAVQKARFRRVSTVNVAACASTGLANPVTELPGHATDGDVPKIAVTSGNSDHLYKVLDDLGIEYDCIKNGGSSSDACTSAPTTLAQLLTNPTLLNSYAMLFIACQVNANTEASALGGAGAKANLAAWVAAGGKLIATDDSYDFVEQVFPAEVDFEPTTTTPEVAQPFNAAQIGSGGLHVDGAVHDTTLSAWLQTIGVLQSDGTVPITGFLSDWAVINSTASDATVLVDGPVSWTGGSGTRPLTVEFVQNGCGRVVFTSYHTSGTASSTGLLPQERILEYLMVEVGECVTPR